LGSNEKGKGKPHWEDAGTNQFKEVRPHIPGAPKPPHHQKMGVKGRGDQYFAPCIGSTGEGEPQG